MKRHPETIDNAWNLLCPDYPEVPPSSFGQATPLPIRPMREP